ncbi:MAG: VWA domain-containing protein, partial [Planctomycetes bacterium]|nr:VWA domain-containing protein [Planctomycetota bacterium]
MPAPPFLAKMPRPALFALTGALAGFLVALTAGELVWYLLQPSPPAQQPAPAPRDEPPAEPPTPPPTRPGPRLAVSAAPVTAYPGGKNTFGVRVARDTFEGPVTVRFEPTGGLTAAEISIPATETIGKAEVVVPPDVKAGGHALAVVATAAVNDHTIRASTAVRVTVPALPPPPARMAVSTSPKVQVYQKGKNTFTVRVTRADFDDPVTVAFEDLPDGVKVPAVTVPAGKTEATAELTADAAAKLGAAKVTVTARAVPKGVATSATAEVVAEILDPNRAPVDVVLVLDCTGSMRKSVDGLSRGVPVLAAELDKARLDARFGLVGFRDTTLGQPLERPLVGGARMSGDVAQFARVVRGLRLGGGGGDGESSLDGLEAAADYPLRAGAARVLVLVTDGPPKRSDGRIKSADMAVKHLVAKRIDQLHVVALPEHLKRFEPLWEGPKGKFFDLKAATADDAFDKLMTDLGKVIAGAVPPQPEPKPEPSVTAGVAVLPEPAPVKPPAAPGAPEPEEPRFAPTPPTIPPALPTPAPSPPQPEVTENRPAPEGADGKPLALTAWGATVGVFACLVLFLS